MSFKFQWSLSWYNYIYDNGCCLISSNSKLEDPSSHFFYRLYPVFNLNIFILYYFYLSKNIFFVQMPPTFLFSLLTSQPQPSVATHLCQALDDDFTARKVSPYCSSPQLLLVSSPIVMVALECPNYFEFDKLYLVSLEEDASLKLGWS